MVKFLNKRDQINRFKMAAIKNYSQLSDFTLDRFIESSR